MIKILSAINTHEAANSFQTYLIRRRMVMSLVYSNQIIINKGKNNIHDIIENLSGMYIYHYFLLVIIFILAYCIRSTVFKTVPQEKKEKIMVKLILEKY